MELEMNMSHIWPAIPTDTEMIENDVTDLLVKHVMAGVCTSYALGAMQEHINMLLELNAQQSIEPMLESIGRARARG